MSGKGESEQRRTDPHNGFCAIATCPADALTGARFCEDHWEAAITERRTTGRHLSEDEVMTPALPRRITPAEVQVGDRVRWLNRQTGDLIEGTPTGCWGSEAPCPGIEFEAFGLQEYTEHVELTLLARPLPPIPTDEGTVIRRKGSGVLMVWVTDRAWVFVNGLGAYAGIEPTREDWDVLVPDGLS